MRDVWREHQEARAMRDSKLKAYQNAQADIVALKSLVNQAVRKESPSDMLELASDIRLVLDKMQSKGYRID